MNPFSKVAIVGIGETKVGKIPGTSVTQLQAEATRLALEDCGIAKDEVDGVFSFAGYSRPATLYSAQVSEYLGVKPVINAQIEAGGVVTALMALFNAASAVASGLCHVALCTFAENPTSRQKSGGRHEVPMAYQRGAEEFEEPFGAVSMPICYALIAQRHMHEYGTTSQQLGAVAVSTRKHACLNPTAVMRTTITLEDHQSSRMIASPLRLLDCCLTTDGGTALIITSADRAKDLRRIPISILGFGMQTTHRIVMQAPDIRDLGIKEAGQRAFAMAGLTLADVDVAEIYDAFTICTIIGLESLGFCGEGEGGAYAAEGRLELGNKTPVNTHGGLLSHAHCGGSFHITEAIKQLRGECGPRQVKDAKVALVAGHGGVFSTCGAMFLGRGLP